MPRGYPMTTKKIYSKIDSKKEKVRSLIDKHNNRYFFRVGKDIEEHPRDIIKGGILLAYRLDKDKTRNPYGEVMGMSGKAFNSCGRLKIGNEIPEEELHELIEHKLLEAKGLSPAPLKTPLISRYQGKDIITDSTGSYIKAVKNCAACPNLIEGKQYLTFNAEGLKVVVMSSFEADDPNVTRASNRGRKKLLCPECIVKTIKIEEAESAHELDEVEEIPEEGVPEEEVSKKDDQDVVVSIPFESVNKTVVTALEDALKLKKRVAHLEKFIFSVCHPSSNAPEGYLKGLVYAYMILLQEDKEGVE